jgi:deazaflavin-dependent oxidoreductase (nitroreductase family)
MEIDLVTEGRRSGRPHRVTLLAFADGGRLVVVGSYGGSARDPDWVANLRATPRAVVRRGGESIEHIAREAAGEERARLWELVTTSFPLYETYQGRTGRVIPLFVLEPGGSGG